MAAVDIKIIEAKTRIKMADELISALQKNKKNLEKWLEKQSAPRFETMEPEKPSDEAYTPVFENLWILYPSRNGVKAGKKEAFRYFKKMKGYNIEDLKKACWNYAAGNSKTRGMYTKDMVRFLKDNDFWQAWINPTTAMLHGSSPQEKSNINSIVEEAINGKK